MTEKIKHTITLPARLRPLHFTFNGKLDKASRYMDNRPAGKVHITWGNKEPRCGIRGAGMPWNGPVHSEDVCKRCLRHWLNNSTNQVEIEI